MKSLRSVSLVLLLAGIASAQPDKDNYYTSPRVPSPDVLDRLNLKLAWNGFVPMDDRRDGILSFQFAPIRRDGKPRMHLLVQTRSGLVIEIDGETGQQLWRTRAGNPNSASHGLGFNSTDVAAVRGTEVYGISRKDGDVKWKLPLKGVPATTPLMDSSRLYLNIGTDRVEFYDLPAVNEGRPSLARSYRSTIPLDLEPSQTSPPRQEGGDRTPGFLFFPSPRGSVSVLSKDSAGLFLRFETRDALTVPPGIHEAEGGVYIGGRDSNVYGHSLIEGEASWRFTAGVPIERKPFVNDEDVYVTGAAKGMFRLLRRKLTGGELLTVLQKRGLATRPQVEEVIAGLKGVAVGDAASILTAMLRKGYLTEAQQTRLRWRGGEEAWAVPEADRMIAANPKFVYAMDRSGRLLVIHRDRGQVLSRFDMRGYPVGISNEMTDRLYLAAHNGFIICLHDREYVAPVKMKSAIEPPAPPPPKDPKDPPKDPLPPKDGGAAPMKPEKP